MTVNTAKFAVNLPVVANYDRSHKVGRVIAWEDQGDGTVMGELELTDGKLTASLGTTDGLAFGLDAIVRRGEDDPGHPTVKSIERLNSIGVWPKNSRPGPT